MIDPFPYVSNIGSRHAHPGTINAGYRLRYDPRSGYDDLTEEEFFELKGWT